MAIETPNPFAVLGDSPVGGAGVSSHRVERDASIEVGTLNVNGALPFMPFTGGILSSLGVDVCGVQETYLPHVHRGVRVHGYKWFGRNLAPGCRRGVKVDHDSHGIGFLVSRRLAGAVSVISGSKFRDSLWIKVKGGSKVRVPLTIGRSVKGYTDVETSEEMWIGVYYLSPHLPAEKRRMAVLEMKKFITAGRVAGAKIVVLGDLNCVLRPTTDPLRSKDRKFTARERSLLSMFKEQSLASLHTKVGMKMHTFHRRGDAVSMLDYILVDQSDLTAWGQPRVHCNLDTNSDHWLLSCPLPGFLRAVGNGESSDKPIPAARRQGLESHPGWNTSLLRKQWQSRAGGSLPAQTEEDQPHGVNPIGGAPVVNHTYREELAKQSAEAFREWDGGDGPLPETYASFERAFRSVCDSVLGKPSTRKKFRRRKMPQWVDAEMWAAICRRRKAWAKLRSAVNYNAPQADRMQLWNSFRELASTARTLAKSKKKSRWASVMAELVDDHANNPKRFWRFLSRYVGQKNRKGLGAVFDSEGTLVEPEDERYPEVWRKHFETLGTAVTKETNAEVAREHRRIVAQADRDEWGNTALPTEELRKLNSDVTEEEVTTHLLALPAGKAAGPDGIPNELLKAAFATRAAPLVALFNRVMQLEEVAKEWQVSLVCPIPKKGDLRDTGNYRGISLMSCLGKLFGRILNARLTLFLETKGLLIPEQGGFRKTRECAEHSFVLQELTERRDRASLKTYGCFIDMRKAYDLVWRKALWVKLESIGVGGRVLRLLRNWYRTTLSAVRVNGVVSSAFPLELGVKQGDVLSPLLFNVFINDILSDLKSKGLGVSIPGDRVRDSPFSPPLKNRIAGLLWADDLVVLAETPNMMGEVLTCITRWCDTWKMEANALKCAVLVFCSEGNTEEVGRLRELNLGSEPLFAIQGVRVPVKEHYKYLGVWVSGDLSWQREMDERLKRTSNALNAKARILRCHTIPARLRLLVLESTVVPVALWGTQCWCTSATAGKISAILCKGYRWILGLAKGAASAAVLLELGVIPFELRVKARRVRLLAKMVSKTKSGAAGCLDWSTRLLITKPPQSKRWSWKRRTCDMAKKLGLGDPALKVLSPSFNRRVTEAEQELLRSAVSSLKANTERVALEAFLHKADTMPSLAVLRALQEDEGGYKSAAYLGDHEFPSGNRLLARMRTGSTYLSRIASKFDASVEPECPVCKDGDETVWHLLVGCEGYEAERQQWLAGWGDSLPPGSADALVAMTELLTGLVPVGAESMTSSGVRTLLGDQPAVFSRGGEEALRSARLIRAKALAAMWRVRSVAYQAAKRKPKPSPGIEADTGVT
ncbi:RNA-directed DNA polymerase [Candidatus Gracilibacteria bacterium]|nr:RNA-directed DNA polymerase [Candidatus Gracilibacteria bacterium]